MGAMVLISTGKWDPQKDLPRCKYQKIRFAHFNPGKTLSLFRQVVEMFQQSIANGILHFLPCFLVASSPSRESLTAFEIGGFATWALAWSVEIVF